MSPEKLAQLRRQRELVKQHLDWLDAEIALHSGEKPTPLNRQTPAAPALDPVDPTSAEIDDPLLQHDPLSSSTEAKRGCLILFCVAFGLLAAILAGIYFWKYSDRPLLFPDKAADASWARPITM